MAAKHITSARSKTQRSDAMPHISNAGHLHWNGFDNARTGRSDNAGDVEPRGVQKLTVFLLGPVATAVANHHLDVRSFGPTSLIGRTDDLLDQKKPAPTVHGVMQHRENFARFSVIPIVNDVLEQIHITT